MPGLGAVGVSAPTAGVVQTAARELSVSHAAFRSGNSIFYQLDATALHSRLHSCDSSTTLYAFRKTR